MVFKANGAASFSESLRIHTLEVSLSLMVTSAPLWLLPITVSISKSPVGEFNLQMLEKKITSKEFQ
jgi:hypothetical protein